METLLANVSNEIKDGYYYSPCNPSTTGYVSIFFNLSGNLFEVPPSSYVLSHPNYLNCPIAIVKSPIDEWIFGDTFLENFYSVWDHESSQVSFGPHVNSAASIIPAPRD
jgi:hypothetical protein